MKILSPVCAVLSFAGLAVIIRAADPVPTWKAGVASVSITPKANMWMGGYAARTHPSTGTAQNLNAKALALGDERGGRFVFIAVDAIGIPRELRQRVSCNRISS